MILVIWIGLKGEIKNHYKTCHIVDSILKTKMTVLCIFKNQPFRIFLLYCHGGLKKRKRYSP